MTSANMTLGLRPLVLNSEEQDLHVYNAKVLDVNTKKPYGSSTSITVNYVAKLLQFPSGPPQSNASLRIATKAVYDSRPVPRAVQDVIYVVNMYNAKIEQQKSINDIDLKDYFEVTSGSKKNGTRDNRKWIRLGDHERYDRIDTLELEEQVASFDSILPEADRKLAVCFEHEHIDLNNLPAVIKKSATVNGNFQTSITDYAGQIVKKHERREPLMIIGSRVFTEQSTTAYGLQRKTGFQGTIAYDREGKANLVREKCVAHFFPLSTVSAFISRFFGLNIGSRTDEKMLARISAVLKGMEVNVSFNGVEPNRVCHIIGAGSSTQGEAGWLRAFGELSSVDREPAMPSVNIGSKAYPVYHPSELCQIVGENQIFKGQLPFSPSINVLFEPGPLKNDGYEPKSGDPYPKDVSKGLDITFINLAEEVDGNLATAVNNDVMESFKEQICKRYNSTLEWSASGKTFQLTPATFASTLLPFLTSGIKTAVLVVTPQGLSSSEIDKLRIICDTQLGVQCNFVSSREVIKRFHPVHNLKMKLITGGIVQNIFARAKITKGGESLSTATQPLDFGNQLYGINIREQRTCGDYLVDMITISGENFQDVRVTSYVFRAINNDALASSFSSFIRDTRRGSSKSLTIYIRGIKKKTNENVLQLLSSSIDKWFLKDPKFSASHRSFTLVSVLQGPNILMFNKDDTILLNQPFAGAHQPLARIDIATYQETTESATARVFNLLPHHSATRTTYSPMSVTYLKSNIDISDTIVKSSAATLSTHKLPTILYLAGEASKRSQLRIHQKTAAELKLEQDKLAADFHLKYKERKQEIADDILQLVYDTVGQREAEIAKRLKDDKTLIEEGKKTSQPMCEVSLKPVHCDLKDTFYFL